MKRLLVIFLAVVFLAVFPVMTLAECEDPTGKTFSTTNCEQLNMTLTFSDAVFSPIPECQRGVIEVSFKEETVYFPYAWNAASCTAKLYAKDCETESPILWLRIEGNTIMFLDMPTFLVVE